MTIPVWVLLGFAGWTLVSLLSGVGVYQWSRILTGRTEMKDFRAAATDFYTRATRAHANCVENLPAYAAIVFACHAAGLDDGTLDALERELELRVRVSPVAAFNPRTPG